MKETVDQAIQTISSIEDEKRTPFKIDVFDRLSNKTSKLINNTDDLLFQKGSNRNFSIYFKEPIFVQSVHIDVEGYNKTDKFEFVWDSFNQSGNFRTRETRQADSNKFSAFPNKVLDSFSFKPPRKYRFDPKIKAVRIYGLTWDQFDETCNKLLQIDAEKTKAIKSCQSTLNAAEESAEEKARIDAIITDLNKVKAEGSEKLSNIESRVSELTKNKAAIESTIEERRSKESELAMRIQTLDDNINQKTNESNSLNSQIEQAKTELKKLKDNINIFPSEFTGFVEQGGKNITKYLWLVAIPVGIILVVTASIFYGGVKLTAKYEEMPTMDLITMLGSRVPFVIIAVSILTVCYKLAKLFINEILRINRQRLSLSKISIIAKDVSDTSSKDLDFTKEELYELRTKLKMNLIKSHLKGYIDEDFDVDIEPSLLSRFNRVSLKKKDKKSDKVSSVTIQKSDNDGIAVEVEEG